MQFLQRVEKGNSRFDIKLYTLSTCGWCKKTRRLLEELDLSYQYVDVDLLDAEMKEQAKEELRKYNPRVSYPTIIIDEYTIIGYQKNKILEKVDAEGIKP